jgi:hypothetical protein
MKALKPNKETELKNECDFREIAKNEIEACCCYEYFRESAALRRSFARRLHTVSLRISPAADGRAKVRPDDERLHWQTVIHPDSGLAVPKNADQLPRQALAFALIKAGWHEAAKKNKAPPPWKSLGAETKKEIARCVKRCVEGKSKHPKWHRPLLIQAFLPGQDPGELRSQLEKWKEYAYYSAAADREYFFGLFRLDEAYNEEKAVRAFMAWFRKHKKRYSKTNGARGPKWRERLKQLVVLRIWKRELSRWKRLKLVAEFCDYKGCVREAAAYKDRCKDGRGDEPMSNAAQVEISSARAEARKFFQRFFPGEEPLSR